MHLALAALLSTESTVSPADRVRRAAGALPSAPWWGIVRGIPVARDAVEGGAGPERLQQGMCDGISLGMALGDWIEPARGVEPCAAAAAGATEAGAGGPTRPERSGGSAPTANGERGRFAAGRPTERSGSAAGTRTFVVGAPQVNERRARADRPGVPCPNEPRSDSAGRPRRAPPRGSEQELARSERSERETDPGGRSEGRLPGRERG